MAPFSEEILYLLELRRPTIVDKIYWPKYKKRCCSCSHKQCKTLLRDHMVRLKIMSLYI